jgi:hypothetical protein
VIITTWTELVAELDKALAFATELGLDIFASRFSAFRARIGDLDTIRQKDGDAAALKRFLGDIEVNAVALTESQELATVVPYLRSVPLEPAKKKLQVVLKGPELPDDEDGNSSHARNTMFELNLAARLNRAGMDVDISGEADLEFTCNGLRWFGECKRPYKLETIENNIDRACQQLGKRLSESELAARGLLAISISRPLTSRAPYLEYSGQEELRRSLKEQVGRMVRVIQERMESLERCRRVGGFGLLLAHVLMPAWDVSLQIPTGVQYSAGSDIGRDGRGDGKQLWGLIDRTFTR